MFPDSQIADEFHIDCKIIWHVINYGLTPYCKGIVQKRIIELKSFFVVSYNESLNGKNKKFKMDVQVGYLDKKRQGSESKILGYKISWPCDCKRYS